MEENYVHLFLAVLPKKSEGTLPFGCPPLKSLPYGGKLRFTIVVILLLFPVSTIESPNTKTVGTGPVSFLGSVMELPSLRKKIRMEKIKSKEIETEFPGWNFILIYEKGKARRESCERFEFSEKSVTNLSIQELSP